MNNPVLEIPKSSVDSFELPCGYLDEEGNLHTDVDLKELTGEEEEILAAKNMPSMKKLNRVLSRCVTALGPYKGQAVEHVIPQLTQGDRLFLLIAIRRVSLGDEMPFSTKCPNCELESHQTVNLADLEVKKMPDPRLRTYETVLPKSGKKVVLKVLTGKGEEMISKAIQNGKDIITVAIISRIDSVDGKPSSIPELKALSLTDRNHLRDVWQDHEGGVDTAVNVICGGCEKEFEANIDMAEQGFFNPSATLRDWKNKSFI